VGPPFFEFDDPARGRLSVGAGETVVLLGPSGAGKTRLIRSLLGLPPPGAARVEPPAGFLVRGRPAGPEGLAPLAGWVPDGDGVFLSDTVGDNVARPAGVAASDAAAARDALDLVGLAARAGEPVEVLGRGGRRRVALARALATHRPLLVVDGELDPTIWALLPELLEQARWVETVLLAATSTTAMAHFDASTVALMVDGRIVAQAPLPALAASSDPDVRGVLVRVTGP
jgi:putative ABC transport system ATP-binding protein/lipoprotein-releasing system ATP-binding protein